MIYYLKALLINIAADRAPDMREDTEDDDENVSFMCSTQKDCTYLC